TGPLNPIQIRYQTAPRPDEIQIDVRHYHYGQPLSRVNKLTLIATIFLCREMDYSPSFIKKS
ncbi:MAG TPA: hypothetical protein PLF58_10090, partial [Smithella sp.]|nr:hypothetical protein [Smithella sp.]HOS15004.1 hypothetical protein [Smithella sp.]HPL48609.1 hypothetical protein [Smithella sp.]